MTWFVSRKYITASFSRHSIVTYNIPGTVERPGARHKNCDFREIYSAVKKFKDASLFSIIAMFQATLKT